MKNTLLLLAIVLISATGCGSADSGGSSASPDKTTQTLAESGQSHDGAKGDKGDVGPSGPAGKDGKTIVVSPSMWFDPVEQKYWFTASTGNYSQAVKACTGNWRLPSYNELDTAMVRGAAISTISIWTSTAGASTSEITVLAPIGNGTTHLATSQPIADSNNGLAIRCIEVKSQF